MPKAGTFYNSLTLVPSFRAHLASHEIEPPEITIPIGEEPYVSWGIINHGHRITPTLRPMNGGAINLFTYHPKYKSDNDDFDKPMQHSEEEFGVFPQTPYIFKKGTQAIGADGEPYEHPSGEKGYYHYYRFMPLYYGFAILGLTVGMHYRFYWAERVGSFATRKGRVYPIPASIARNHYKCYYNEFEAERSWKYIGMDGPTNPIPYLTAREGYLSIEKMENFKTTLTLQLHPKNSLSGLDAIASEEDEDPEKIPRDNPAPGSCVSSLVGWTLYSDNSYSGGAGNSYDEIVNPLEPTTALAGSHPTGRLLYSGPNPSIPASRNG